jgi:lysophospholipase L1-like esterase
LKIRNLLFFIIISISLVTSSCQARQIPVASEDKTEYFIWVGDDSLSTGPLDMQVLLFLEIGGYDAQVEMERVISPRNLLSYPPNTFEFLQNYREKKNVFIFLQMYGLEKTFSSEEFLANANQWVEKIKNDNTQVVLMYPWFSQVDSIETRNQIDALMHQFAWKQKLAIIPVAPAWELVIKENPEIQLYASDGIHPSAEGVYLTACVFYSAITGNSPLGLPAKTSIGYDQPDQIITLSDPVIQILQKSAWDIMEDYEQKNEFQVFLLKSN